MQHVKLTFCILFSLLFVLPATAKNKPRIIAHRGYWTIDGSAQNSLQALREANRVKVYGSEFDVHLTADNIPVVFHDSKVNGIAIQEADYATIKDIQLANGETIPTLEAYLECAKPLKKTKLIFELKSHATPERDREAARYVVDMIDSMKLTKRTEYIAFSLEAAKELHRLSPKTPVYYLNGDLSDRKSVV